MSLRHEQRRALRLARELLADIVARPQRLMVRSVIRMRAGEALKHFPPLAPDDCADPMWSQDTFEPPPEPPRDYPA